MNQHSKSTHLKTQDLCKYENFTILMIQSTIITWEMSQQQGYQDSKSNKIWTNWEKGKKTQRTQENREKIEE
jgi:hypothetical protein